MKYLIQLEDGKYVESFFCKGICITSKKENAGKYTKSIANKRLSNLNTKGVLIPIN